MIQDYMNAGWLLTAIPLGSKGPMHGGWNTRGAAIKDAAAHDLTRYGVGLMHAYSGTMCLDVDDWDETKRYGIDLDALCAAPDAVIIDSGRPGRGKLLYRMPFGTVLPRKQYTIKKDGKTHAVFDFRCGTTNDRTVQDVLPPSIHPDTGKPYKWAGAGHWSRPPMLPLELLRIWQSMLVDVRPVNIDGVVASWDEIRTALEHINPDCSREDWITIGMSLHWAGNHTFNLGEAFDIWNNWSQGAPHRYPGERGIAQQWSSFSVSRTTPITIASLYHLARQAGWVRPTPDASVLFSGVKPAVPQDVLRSLRPAPPDLDVSLWPPILATRAKEVSDGVGCDILAPLWAGLGAVCGVVDARSRLELMPGFQVPPVLWLMVIGNPADKKSPGVKPMLKPLEGIEAADRPRYKADVLAWEAKMAAYSSSHKAFLHFHEQPGAELDASQAPVVPPQPDDPVPLRITVGDVTSQQLMRMAADRPRGMLCNLDEMNAWVTKLTSRMSGEDRSSWVVSYEASRYEMDRVGSTSAKGTSIRADNLAVSIIGNMQPRVLKENFQSLTSDGLLQRFLPAVLRYDRNGLGNPLPEYLTHAAQWDATLRLIFSLPPTIYTLSPDAYQKFREFQQWYEHQKQNERLLHSSDAFLTAFGKIEGLAGRLILLFSIIESPFSTVVGPDVVDRVVKLIKGYVIPTYRYVMDEQGSMSAFDAWVVDYIIHHADEDRIKMSVIKAGARRQWEANGVTQNWLQSQWVMNAMFILEERGWVARADDGSKEQQGFAEWFINPHLKTAFVDHRKAVVRAKKESRDILNTFLGTGLTQVHAADLLECDE